MAMAEAVAKIENEKEDNYIPEIHTYYTPKIIPLPDRAFDLLLQEDIDEAFEDLLKQFNALSTTHEKQRFAEKYAPFLNIAESLQKKTAELNKNRSSFLFERNEEALQARLIREWREMILRLFGEEYLDDFQYREALGTGNLIPVLATWKLCSPIKLLAAMINSVVLAVKITLKYYLDKVMESVVMDVQHQISAYQNNQHQWLAIAITSLKLISVGLLLPLLYQYGGIYTLVVFSLPLIFRMIECIACPINTLVRPIASYLGISPIGASAAFMLTGGIALCALTSVSGLNLAAAMLLVTWGLKLYCLYEYINIMHYIYKEQPTLFIALTLYTVIAILIGLALPQPDINTTEPINAFILLIYYLTTATSLNMTDKLINNPSQYFCEQVEALPLPTEKLDDCLKKGVLLGHKKATQSHRFFNTPKNAESLTAENCSDQLWACSELLT
jgi:hypothetical protein